MLDAEFCRRLGRLVATFHRTPSATTMSSAQIGTSYCRLVATIEFATLATTMGRTKEFIAGSLVATGESTASTTSVRNAKPS